MGRAAHNGGLGWVIQYIKAQESRLIELNGSYRWINGIPPVFIDGGIKPPLAERLYAGDSFLVMKVGN
jgi:hypothetical protein